MTELRRCGCSERIGIEINSLKLFEELKAFFEEQAEKEVFSDIKVEQPYFIGHYLDLDNLQKQCKYYADKWYKCKCCGCLWEFQYPDFPAMGFVRKFSDGKYALKKIGG